MKTLRNESGQLTLDFLFSAILIFSVAVVLGAMTFALTLTEVIQYVSFSSARVYMAGDINQAAQEAAGASKAQRLLKGLPFLSGAQQNGWITVSAKDGGPGNYQSYRNSIGVPGDNNAPLPGRMNQFVGYQLSFDIPILQPKLPLFGDVASPQDLRAFRVSSFLMREPTTEECMNYTNQAYQVLINLNSGYNTAASSSNMPPTQFLAINDNGC